MNLVREWMEMRNKHPFFGENLSQEKIAEIWDRSATTYSDGAMGEIPEMIIKHLTGGSIISKNSSVMDIGCGPGTYGLRLSEYVDRVICIDKSPRMLYRVIDECKERGIGNISVLQADWDEFCSDVSCDVAFSSLCPPLNSPDSILKMEKHATEWCAYVSSMNDDRGSVHMDIWKEFGKDYTFNGYNTMYPYEYLRSIGRNPEIKIFESHSPYDQTTEDVVEFEIGKFSVYMDVDDKIEGIIRKVADSHSEGGHVHFKGDKRVGLLLWKPPMVRT